MRLTVLIILIFSCLGALVASAPIDRRSFLSALWGNEQKFVLAGSHKTVGLKMTSKPTNLRHKTLPDAGVSVFAVTTKGDYDGWSVYRFPPGKLDQFVKGYPDFAKQIQGQTQGKKEIYVLAKGPMIESLA